MATQKEIVAWLRRKKAEDGFPGRKETLREKMLQRARAEDAWKRTHKLSRVGRELGLTGEPGQQYDSLVIGNLWRLLTEDAPPGVEATLIEDAGIRRVGFSQALEERHRKTLADTLSDHISLPAEPMRAVEFIAKYQAKTSERISDLLHREQHRRKEAGLPRLFKVPSRTRFDKL